jgi:hypothetical protein
VTRKYIYMRRTTDWITNTFPGIPLPTYFASIQSERDGV